MKNLLEKHFDAAFDAPNCIQKLREMILTLAMQGKLVPQDPNDQPASELLEEIEGEKQRLVREGKIKKTKPLPKIKTEELPYDLPKGWEWVRLGDVSTRIHYGYTASANHDLKTIRLLRITDIQENKVDWDSVPGCDIKEKVAAQYLLSNDDILIARTGGTVGKSYLVKDIDTKAVFASYLIRIIPSTHIHVEYLKYFAEGPLYWRQLYEKCSGTGQPNVNGTSLNTLLLPLPPLPEQRRIVARIDQLMVRCDELEKLRAEQGKKRIKTHTSALSRLLSAPNKKDFDLSWQFITRYFSDLYSVMENVAELRKAILQLAMQGKLVPQDPNDQPASELLEEIEAEKQRLVREGKIKKSKPLPEIKSEEIPYELPQGWAWVRLNDFGIWKSGSTPSRSNSLYYGGGIPWVKSGEVKVGKISRTEESITEQALKKCSLDINRVGSVLVAMYGANIGDVGILEIEATTNQAVCACNPFHGIENRFLFKLLVSLKPKFVFQGAGAAQPNISRVKIVHTIVPLPPLPEQHRIVARIDQLMARCDELEKQIEASSEKQNAILESVLNFGTALI